MQRLYSDMISSFLKKTKHLVQHILTEEMNLQIRSNGFIVQDIFYPLQLVIFEHPSTLGYFKQDFFEIGINKAFLFESETALLNLLRHELAHYVTFIKYGPDVSPHGTAFQATCKSYGWCHTISRATLKIEKTAHNERLLDKVHKLLALGQSPHLHEAEAAVVKAQELLAKYNLDLKGNNDTVYLTRILPQKRNSEKLRAIASIARTFFVYSIFTHSNGSVYLELIGEKTNVEIAEYVAHFLDQKLDILWTQTQQENPQLKGQASKNSFFRGLSQGYLHKTQTQSNALIKLEKQLIESAHRIYPNLRTTKRAVTHHEMATQLGYKKSKHLNIHEGIAKPSKIHYLDHVK